MADLKDYALPTEVFEAALGNPAPLADLLRSNEPLTEWTREALAKFVEGQLQPLKKSRGGQSKFQDPVEFHVTPQEVALRFVKLDGMSHEEAAEAAMKNQFIPATKMQILQYLKKSEKQRPKPPKPSGDVLCWYFTQYQRRKGLK